MSVLRLASDLFGNEVSRDEKVFQVGISSIGDNGVLSGKIIQLTQKGVMA